MYWWVLIKSFSLENMISSKQNQVGNHQVVFQTQCEIFTKMVPRLKCCSAVVALTRVARGQLLSTQWLGRHSNAGIPGLTLPNAVNTPRNPDVPFCLLCAYQVTETRNTCRRFSPSQDAISGSQTPHSMPFSCLLSRISTLKFFCLSQLYDQYLWNPKQLLFLNECF